MSKVSILIPFVRKEQVTRAITAALWNAGVDVDDIEIIAEEDKERIGCPSMLKKLVAKSSHDLVAFLGDDTIPMPNYLATALETMERFPDGWGLVGFNDAIWDGNEKMSTHWLAHKKLLDHLDGEFFHSGYKHCRCDVELADRTRALGRYVWEPNAFIQHIHPIALDRPDLLDHNYVWVYNDVVFKHDIALYEHRKRNGWKTKGFSMDLLSERFDFLCNTPSDIHQHLPTLKEFAGRCSQVTEFGFRGGVSTTALLLGKPAVLITHDINPACADIYRFLKQMVKQEETDFRFVLADTRAIDIEETEFLFIDSEHSYAHCKAELERHASKVKRYIGFHDTVAWGDKDEFSTGPGLMPAINEFTAAGGWKIAYATTVNNGLMILERA